MILAIHQPEHLVWLGLLDKIRRADAFVIFDSVQFKKNYFENRNRIKTAKGPQWLTVPVRDHSLHTAIKDIEIASVDWRGKYLAALRTNYGTAPFFRDYFPGLETIINGGHTHVAELNIELLMFMLRVFGIEGTTIVRSSELGLAPDLHGSELCLEVCKKMHARTYLAGTKSHDYLNLKIFADAGIDVVFQDFKHPEYPQQHGAFIPGLSAIDALFNLGPDAGRLLACLP